MFKFIQFGLIIFCIFGKHIKNAAGLVLHFKSLVGGNNLVDPTAQVGDTGVHGRGAHIAIRGAPGDNTDKRPHTTILADQRAPGVALECQNTDRLRQHAIFLSLIYFWSTIIKL